MASKKKIRDLVKPVDNGGLYSKYGEVFNLLLNAVKIVSTEDYQEINFNEETFVKTALFERNIVGYDALVKKWTYGNGEGVNELGNPTQCVYVTVNGRTWTRDLDYEPKADGAYIIYGLPYKSVTMGAIIKETTDFVEICEQAMRQNLEACKTPYIVVVKDEDMKLSYETAIEKKQSGQAVVLVSEELGDGLKAVNIATTFLTDKFEDVRDREYNRLLNKIGIMTNNEAKKERVQSAEVNATIGQATDYIYLLIDTFNKQMKSYGLPFEMQLNGSLEEIYVDTQQDDEPNANDGDKLEKGNNNNA